MDRTDLGSFGAELAEGELAQAVVALAAVGAGLTTQQPADAPRIAQRLRERQRSGISPLATGWLRLLRRQPHAEAAVFAQAWREFLSATPEPRLEISPAGSPDLATWLARQARHREVGAGSVYLRVDAPAWPVAWQWPLRLGVLGDGTSHGQGALPAALRDVGFANLWTVVDVDAPGAECELLLLPGDLRQGLAEVLQAAHRPRADCVLVLQGHRISQERAQLLAAALRREARTAGVAVLSLHDAVPGVLTEIVRELAHDATLDRAIFRALARARPAALPEALLLFSRNLAAHSSVRLSARRMATSFTTPGGEGLARHLQDIAARGRFEFEGTDASEIVHVQRQMRDHFGVQARSAPVTARALPPEPRPPEDTRQVLAQVREPGAEQPSTWLKRDCAYRLRVKIAEPESGFLAAGQAFPALPPSSTGHWIDISFVPLAADAQGQIAPAQWKTVLLPPQGPSEAVEFAFGTHGLAGTFAARLVVSYQNRVLQLLRLEGALNAPDAQQPAPINLAALQEGAEVVYPGFQNLAYQPPFDAALVANDSAAGRTGLTALAGSTATFTAPEGLDKQIALLQATITNETALRKTEAALDSPALTDLLFALMQHGHLLYDAVQPQIGALDADAGRIQVVEARPGAFFPVEFLYPLPVPQAKPPLCPNAAAALAGEQSHQQCPHRDDPEHMCPLRFWGFRKQLERQPSGVAPAEATKLLTPTPAQARLDLFRAAQVARSCKVQPPDFDLPDGLLHVLKEVFGAVNVAPRWRAWTDGIAHDSPGFLLLLSHSTSDAISLLPALEISEDVLSVASIEAGYVRGPQAPAPVVFLLGCDTADPGVGFLNFVERFKRKQAALVVGTLSTISAQRAARFLALALPLFKAAEKSGRSFGEVFLQVKRAALARGDGFALTLVAYGDTGWQL